MPKRKARNSHNANTRSSQHAPIVGFNKLKGWADLDHDPDELLLEIMMNLKELKGLLSQSLNKDKLQLLADILETALKAKHHEQCFGQFLDTLVATKFFASDLALYLNRNTCIPRHRLASMALVYIQEGASRIPNKMDHCNQLVVFLCENYYSLSCDVNAVIKMRDSFQARLKEKSATQCHAQQRELDIEDFTNLPTLPTHRDLKPDCKPFLRAIKVCGAYHDRHEYLDIMYRLFREDLVQPLREAVRQVKAGNNSNVVYFENVKIVGVEMKEGIVHLMQLDISRLKDFKSIIKNSTGNLVCVSHDNFQSFLFATYANNTDQELSNGIVRLNFLNCQQDVFSLCPDARLKLIESPSFYEAYSHVLEGLKSWCEIPLPLQSYLISCKCNSDKPAYLSQSSVYDISCLMQDKVCHAIRCKVLSTETWPFVNKTCLNHKQLEAVKEALTKELTLIQGPPGTGKTFVSLKIMRTLLENMSAQSPNNGPVLVVCYTNHALDQFLEGILKFCNEGVIRVGGNSKCEALESCNLAEVCKNDKARCKNLNKALYNIYKKMEPLEKRIKKLTDKLIMANQKVLDERVLGDFMIECHRQSFFDNVTENYSGSVMNHWLTMDDTDFESYLQDAAEARAVSLLLLEKGMCNDTCLDFSKTISFATKAMVYRMWLDNYEQKFGRLEKMAMLSDKQLKPFVSDKVLSRIYSNGYSTIRSWVLGRNLEEILTSLECLLKKKINLPIETFSDSEDDSNETMSNDSYDSDPEADTAWCDYEVKRLENSSLAISFIKRMKFLGVNLTPVTNPNSSSNHRISYSEALRRIEMSPLASSEEEKGIINVWTLSVAARFKLYKSWRSRYMESLNGQMNVLYQQYLGLVEAKNELYRMRNISILGNAKVVGMTTTGAAKHRKVLEAVGPRIVVVEEAAEVQEAHIITALSQKCQHLILIGDHKQLRPKVQVYELAQHYHLDVSLFERLVENNFKCIQLEEQFRMRPEVSIFMRHIYPDLKDGESVKSRPAIAGMDKCVFFIKHNKPEQKLKQGTSKMNTFEGKYLLKLSEYLISQGHESSHITILAAYGGQVTSIQDLLSASRNSALQEIRVSTIDNFQGEENKIILLSLVRSNSENQVGFLSTDNRVCVALSRAQFGMYVIGDIDLLSRSSQLWRNIKITAEEQNCIGRVLRLSCQQHHRFTEIFKVADFDQAIQRKGCGLPCETKLICGHLCSLLCHIGNHDNYVCREKCLRLCPRGHGCRKRCNDPCPPCMTLVHFELVCGHIQTQPCSVDTTMLVCQEKCMKMCPKGHLCPKDCKVRCPPCPTLVERHLSCGHVLNAQCHKRNVECIEQCDKTCDRGHKCFSKCSKLCLPCREVMTCGHICASIPKSLALPDTYKPCLQPCKKVCSRGHQCPSKCHEICPLYCGRLTCKIIGLFSIKKTGFDTINKWISNQVINNNRVSEKESFSKNSCLLFSAFNKRLLTAVKKQLLTAVLSGLFSIFSLFLWPIADEPRHSLVGEHVSPSNFARDPFLLFLELPDF